MYKIRCFHSHEYGHYATKCPQKVRKKDHVVAVAGEALASQFKLDFTLITCIESIIIRIMWYLIIGASFHMIGNRDLFNDSEEKDLQQSIEFLDDERYSVTNIGTITF